jgi:hypothetical protein
MLLAAPILALAVAILLPIPLGNQLPALAIIVIAFGLMLRDGIAVIGGLALAILALLWNTAVVLAGAELAAWFARLFV